MKFFQIEERSQPRLLDAPGRGAAWLKPAVQVAAALVLFLAGMLFMQVVGGRPETRLPTYAGLPVATASPAPTAAPTPQPVSASTQELPLLEITIPPTYFEQIAAVRDKALKVGILLAEDNIQVPAVLRYDGVDMPIQIGLKGDWTDHLRGDKWSFRVKIDDNYRLFGIAVFSIYNPPVRNYANEWAYMTSLQRDGVMGLRYRFVNVVLNGQPKGIYALEEGFSKELFEAQQRREGLLLRYSEDLIWTYRSLYANRYAPPGVDAFHIIEAYQDSRSIDAPGLSNQREAAFGMLRGVWSGQLPASHAFDVDKMGRFLALTMLWGGNHGLVWHNLRYFYNPVSTRLEPIGFNANALDPASPQLEPPRELFFDDPQLKAAYVKAALGVTSPDYLDALQADLGQDFASLNRILSAEFGELPLPWDTLRSRAQQIRQQVEPYQAVYAYLPSSQPGSLDVGNVLDWPVQLVGLQSEERFIPFERAWTAADSQSLLVPDVPEVVLLPLSPEARDVAYVRLSPPGDVISLTPLMSLTLVTRVWGAPQAAVQRQPAWRRYPPPRQQAVRPNVTLEQALARHPFLAPGQDVNWLLVEPGDWSVDGDLTLPAGYSLHIGAGTTLRFAEGADLITDDGGLLFEGEPDAPIVLTARTPDGAWGGIAVMEAALSSVLRYAVVERTGGLHRAGWATTAGVTFYKSPVRLANCRFLHNQTEDAINFIQTTFEVLDSEFAYTYADALDGDFANGLIERSAFHAIGNDGLDVSGTPVTIRQVTLDGMGDKGVSIGENSRADIQGLTVRNASMGVVVKDGSSVLIRDASLAHIRIAGLAAYTKKTEYGPAIMTATDIRFEDAARQTLVQTGHRIDLEGQTIWGEEVDVNKLYLPFTKER